MKCDSNTNLIAPPVYVVVFAAPHVLTGQAGQIPVRGVGVDALGDALPVLLHLQTNKLLTTAGLRAVSTSLILREFV